MTRILIIRFSSIGDIVLTTPVIRAVRQQLKDVELHFVTKQDFLPVLKHNPYLHRIHVFKKDIDECVEDLKKEQFDFILDLHNNLRSARLKRLLERPSASVNKLNLRKFLAVYFKMRGVLPAIHIVDRYLEAANTLDIRNDGRGLDYFITASDEVNVAEKYFGNTGPVQFLALVIGGSYFTKKIPVNKLEEIIQNSPLPVLLMGGPGDLLEARQLMEKFPKVKNSCGELSINQSASAISQAEWVITSDTGLMHIAAAFNKKIISVWGNTIPEFGMSVYKARPENKILQVKNLPCRPCSKLGYGRCPMGHFKCMQEIDFTFVKDLR